MTRDNDTPRTDGDGRTGRSSDDLVDRGDADATASGSDAIATAASPSRPTGSRQLAVGAIGILGIAAVLAWLAGPTALPVAAAVAAVWYVTSAPYAVAAAHVALVALAPSVPGAALVAFEASALALLLGDVPDVADGVPVVVLLGTVVATAGLAGIAYGGLAANWGLWATAVALAGAFALCAYGLHRYAVVRQRLREGAYE